MYRFSPPLCRFQAWIQNATVKQNILFGAVYDEARYRTAIRVSALERDLQILPDGDETEIGEKGINLSGGQKQRVSLARLLYYNADTVLLDDPLSAVDPHVSQFLFKELIAGALSDKTRVLVTHQLQYVRFADHVVVRHSLCCGTCSPSKMTHHCFVCDVFCR